VVLLHCNASIDRAPFCLAAYMARSCHSDMVMVYREIKKIRPSLIEHPEWMWWTDNSYSALEKKA